MPEEDYRKTCRKCKEKKYPFDMVFSEMRPDTALCKDCRRLGTKPTINKILANNALTTCCWDTKGNIRSTKT
jgi:hypothetical protein